MKSDVADVREIVCVAGNGGEPAPTGVLCRHRGLRQRLPLPSTGADRLQPTTGFSSFLLSLLL